MTFETHNSRGLSWPVLESQERIRKILKINAVLMNRVERSLDEQTNAFALFQTAVALENEVKARTAELKSALERLEHSNKELIAAREAAERANRSKSGFFTAASHDLLQPVHAARLTLSTLADVDSREESRHLLPQIDHALSTIEELLTTLLEIAKLDAGIIKPSVKPLSLQEIFLSLASDLQPLARARKLPLQFRETRFWIDSDPLMMRRIIQNLVVNAIRYTDAGGVRVFAKAVGRFVDIGILDTGPGIEHSERSRIFEEFQRGSTSERSGAAGLGLGLSIVSRMAESLGHRVSLWSRPGLGSCFRITAPAALPVLPTLALQSANAIPTYGLASAKVLVVENDETVVGAMHRLLASWGCDIRLALGLEEAQRLCKERKFRPDLILADYHLDHGECGLQSVECFRAIHGKNLPAIVITADYDQATAGAIQKAGCELMRKPVKPAELRSLIAHILG